MKEKNDIKMPLTNALLLLQQFSSAFPGGIMVCDMEGSVYFRNNVFDNWLPGHKTDSSLWYNQLQPYIIKEQLPDSAYLDSPVKWLLDNKTGQDIELEIIYLGQTIFFKIRVYPLLDDKNKLSGLIEISENITEQKRVEKSLEHARRFETVGRLASGIAHDFNNILQVINGHSEMLIESRKDDSRLMHSLEIILTSGQKASALTRQLLLFSRRQQSDFKQINLGKQLVNMQKILSRMLGEDITMYFQCNDQDLYIDADESQIEQIIMNLAINARDAMPEGGIINIKTDFCEIDAAMLTKLPFSKSGKYVCLSFADNGCGIAQDVLEHIFEPFFSTKEAGRGTGLGLASTYGIVKQHQGFIHVESSLENGTVFMIYFPLSEMKKQAEIECPDYIPQPGCKKRVLIIEDDENVQDLAVQVLTQYDYQVTSVFNLAQAVSIAQKELFDLFLIDVVLPDGNGVDLIESLTGKNAKAAFILSSGYTEDKPQIKNTIYKGYSFLHKPYTINSLLQACSEALNSKIK